MKHLIDIEDIIKYLQSVDGKVYSVPKIQKNIIINATSFLPEFATISQRIYHLINNIIDIPKCKCCNKELEYKRLRGYGIGFCNTNCYNIFRRNEKENLKEIRNSRKLSNTDSYIECRICGCAVKSIATHLSLKQDGLHDDWNLDRYKKQFPNSPIISINTSKLLSELSSGENNAMHKSKTTEEFRKSNSPFSEEFYIKRGFDEIDAKKEVSKFTKNALKNRVSAVSLDYFLEITNGNIEKAQELQSERQNTFTLEKCIKKYGKKEGIKKYKERQDKWQSTLSKNGNKCGWSKISQELFIILNKPTARYGINGGEFSMYNGTMLYLFDYVFNNKIIEYNGDQYHANPSKYGPNDMTHPYRKGKGYTAQDIWNKDKQKIDFAKSQGYEVLVIWDSEYRKNKEETIQKCIEFLDK